VNSAELNEVLTDCPTLFHMAEHGSWQSIRRHGLLSTSALLDKLQVVGEQRRSIESQHRPRNVVLSHPSFGGAVIRDQKPMDDGGLRRCLQGGLSPQDWYQSLNSRVFFWLTKDRLCRLLAARAYRDLEHDVLEVDARTLVQAYRASIVLSPINSGCTKPFPHPRGETTFMSIDDYPYGYWRPRRARGERVVELALKGAVPDIQQYVLRAIVMKGCEERRILWKR
jgi:hypothetical protein